MYSHIAANKRKTILLIGFISALLIGLGWFLGKTYGDSNSGIIAAVILSTTLALFSYFAGDKAALLASGARRLRKEDHPELWRLVENLSITAGLPMPRIYLINDPALNAFATGRNPRHASVAVTSGLLHALERRELEGVIAHELSHVKNYDILVMTAVIILVGAIMLLADFILRLGLFGSSERKHGQLAAGLAILGLVLAILSPLFAQLIKLAVSRSREFLADASGAMLTRYPEGLASALEKIARTNQPLQRANHATAHLFIANPFGVSARGLAHFFSTHPPITERITRLRNM